MYTAISVNRIWRFPKIRGTILRVPKIRIVVFGGLYWVPLILGNYHLGLGVEGLGGYGVLELRG